jgi:hypothetical protein
VGLRGQERASCHSARQLQRRAWGNPPEAWKRTNEAADEAAAVLKVREAARLIAEAAPYVWQWGDGNGGWIVAEIEKACGRTLVIGAGPPIEPKYEKARIGRALSRAVMERDAYRCVSCGTHVDLSCDHIIPESKGGPTTLENLQTMCRPCNSRKGAR